MLASAAISAIPEIYKFAQGVKDKRLAKGFADKPRPGLDVPIPQAILDSVRMAKNRAGIVGIPGQGAIQNRIDGNTSAGTRSLIETQQGGASAAAGIAALDANNNAATEDLGVKAGSQNLADLAAYTHTTLPMLAGYEADKFNKEWEWNQRDPYLQSMAAASALRNSGEQNIYGAIDGISSIASSLLFDNAKEDPVEKVSNVTSYGSAMGPQMPSQGAVLTDVGNLPTNGGVSTVMPGVNAPDPFASVNAPITPSYGGQNPYGVNQAASGVNNNFNQNQVAKLVALGYTPEQAAQMIQGIR